jgi:hypothetical protein
MAKDSRERISHFVCANPLGSSHRNASVTAQLKATGTYRRRAWIIDLVNTPSYIRSSRRR